MKGSEAVNDSQYDVTEREVIVKLEEWMLFILIGIIPILNLFALGYFSFNKKINANKRNFSRAALIYVVVMYALIIVAFII